MRTTKLAEVVSKRVGVCQFLLRYENYICILGILSASCFSRGSATTEIPDNKGGSKAYVPTSISSTRQAPSMLVLQNMVGSRREMEEWGNTCTHRYPECSIILASVLEVIRECLRCSYL